MGSPLQNVYGCPICKTTPAQGRIARYEKRAYADQRSGSIRKVGKAETERRQGYRRARKTQCVTLHMSSCLTRRCPFFADGELATAKSAFSAKFNSLVWFLTTGLQFAIGWWYRKSAVFYLPPNWFGPLTWTLALPFAPRGKSRMFDLGRDANPVSRLREYWGVADGMS